MLAEAPIESMNNICNSPRPGQPANPVTINKAADISALHTNCHPFIQHRPKRFDLTMKEI